MSNVDGIPSYVAVDPQLGKGQVLAKPPDAVRYCSSIYGPYPFSAVGAIVDSAKNLGYSLETQTKPLFPYVPDIWLHEGFATFGNDTTFFKIMRDYAQENRFGNATTATFERTAERDSGLDLGTFFQAWLYTPGKPTSW